MGKMGNNQAPDDPQVSSGEHNLQSRSAHANMQELLKYKQVTYKYGATCLYFGGMHVFRLV
jgi:hypothetical protein